MKKFIAGFLSGAIIFSVVGVFAVNSIYDNPYKITVNGAEKYIQGYNIDDYSYFKLRDIADAVGGFSVGFDEQNQTIVLSTNEDIAAPAAPIEPATPANPTNPADTSSSDIDNLPLGTIPDPLWIEGTDKNGYHCYVTNDEFQIIVHCMDEERNYNYDDPSLAKVFLSDVADKANEIVGEERYGDLGNSIIDRKNDYKDIFTYDTDNKTIGAVPLEYYYLHLAPWLKSLNK